MYTSFKSRVVSGRLPSITSPFSRLAKTSVFIVKLNNTVKPTMQRTEKKSEPKLKPVTNEGVAIKIIVVRGGHGFESVNEVRAMRSHTHAYINGTNTHAN